MNNIKFIRQFVGDYIGGENADALIGTLAEQMDKKDKLSVAVNDQLTISTAVQQYLDKLLASKDIIRPPDLGMEDLSFRQMGIQINAQKQVTEAIHSVLATFYGDETVRAYTTSGISAPYTLEAEDDLIFKLESGEVYTLSLQGDEFESIQSATAEELSDVITRFIRSFNIDGYAQVQLDVDTGLKYVRIYGGAKGPYSFVQILGGSIQSKLEFPDMRDTFLTMNDTVFEVTRNVGSIHRFRWVSGTRPLLDRINPEDYVMIYGNQFESLGINGTFIVTDVRPCDVGPVANAGWFEIDIENFNTLRSSAKDVFPPPNTISATYSLTITQADYDDLKFFVSKRNTPYSQPRYALGWEASNSKLKIYLPATTKVVRRGLIGSAHVHLGYSSGELNGSFENIEIINNRAFRYPQNGYDVSTEGAGTATIDSIVNDVDQIYRENGYTTIITKAPHNLTGTLDQWGRNLSLQVVAVVIPNLQQDAPTKFLGPYIIDPAVPYTLTDKIAASREKISAGQSLNTLLINGVFPDQAGIMLIDLNKDTQEGPIKYLGCQSVANLNAVALVSISQVGTTVTAKTVTNHNLVPEQTVQILGTINFNGVWEVVSTPAPNIYTFSKTPAFTAFEISGSSQPVVDGAISTITVDPSYTFKHTHATLSDITLLSDSKAYEPRPDGVDYSPYVTGTADGRVFAEQLEREITALGINLEVVIIYPSDAGLGNEGGSDSTSVAPASDKIYVWGI